MPNYINVNTVNLNSNMFANNKTVVNVDLRNTSWTNNSMHNAFKNCINLQSITNINNNVTSMCDTFSECTSLVNAPIIPNSVTNMRGTFRRCINLINTPAIPNSVTDMRGTFYNCYSLINVSAIPNSVTGIFQTFRSCINLVNAPTIPNSVTDMYEAFHCCISLVNAPEIPNSVTNMGWTFEDCINLVNAPIIPNSVTDMNHTFYGCRNLVNAPEIPDSVLYMNRTFVGCTNLINVPKISNSVVKMDAVFDNCRSLIEAPAIPNSITNIPSVFRCCYNLVNAPVIPDSITNMADTFRYCSNLVNIPKISNRVDDIVWTFSGCSNLVNAPTIPNSVTNMHGTFDGCRNLIGNIYIQSNRVTNAMRCFNSTTLTKNIYIPFAYENSEYTPTYNSFIAAGYDELGTQHGVYLKDINLLPSTVTLTVNTTPVDATVTFNTGTISGHSVTVPYNTEVSYTVSKEGYKTSETYTHTVTQDETINAPELEPDEPEVELLLDDETKILPAGTYKYICIGGGASGQNAINSSRSVTTTQTRLSGGTGGMGGGSGYITYGDFTLDEDTEISFTVGKGGVQTSTFGSGAPIAGGASTITKVSDSSVLGTASGGIINSSMVGVKSSSGGSGGAAQSGMYANYQLNGYSSRGPSDGHNGGIGGGNGQPHAYQTDEDAAVWVKESGKGYYNTVKSYANNAGVKGSPGTSGGGGIGVSAVQDIITVDFINNMDDTKLQTLYNSIGGGGSGGAATVYDTDTIAGSGGAGGGGGGWFAGEDGAIKSDITTRQATGGNGGDGAILYIKAS